MTANQNDLCMLVARLCIAAVFLYSGVTKALGFSAAVDEFIGLGLPFPVLAVALTVLVQTVGAVGLILGLAVPMFSLALAGFTMSATFVGHQFWNQTGPAFQHELTTALEHLAMVGGLVLLSLTGPGSLSVSRVPRTAPMT